jgi:transposase
MSSAAVVVDFAQFSYFMGFDWSREKHQVVVVDRQGQVVLEMLLEHTAEGWARLREKLQPMLGKLAVALETNNGPAVERLLEMGLAVYPLNPLAAQSYRQRKAPSGVKSDLLDAWSFADALRSDGHGWRVLRPDDENTRLLRMLCRDEVGLIEQQTALVNQLQQALCEYYPAAMEAFEDFTVPSAWAFVLSFPTPAELVAAGRRKWQKFFHTHQLYLPASAEKRMEIFARAQGFASSSKAVIQAKSLLAVSLARQLRTLHEQLKEYRKQIEKLFASHPDHDLFGSLPGAGAKLAPRLLGEVGSNRDVFASVQSLQCFAGTAPVKKQSGKSCFATVRWMCNKPLRAAMHLWVDLSRHYCAWAQAYYQKKRDQGHSHATALRCLGQRWLKILWRMWQDRVPYNEAMHMLNQVRHGSWVIALLPEDQRPAAATAGVYPTPVD